jgi:hypothetical protein
VNKDKFVSIVEREYHIPREKIFLDYSWEEIQDKVTWLPSERIVSTDTAMVKKGRDVVFDKHKYKENYLLALCDRNQVSIDDMKAQAEAFERRWHAGK